MEKRDAAQHCPTPPAQACSDHASAWLRNSQAQASAVCGGRHSKLSIVQGSPAEKASATIAMHGDIWSGFERVAAQRPGHPALVCGDVSINFSQLRNLARRG